MDNTSVLQAVGQDLVNHQESIQEIFSRVENLENQQRKNIRLKILKEQAEGPNLCNYILYLFESILGGEEADQLKIDTVHRVGQFRRNAN